MSVPLHHIGGRGEAGFDLVWNPQPGAAQLIMLVRVNT
jgi:hypothetical protein